MRIACSKTSAEAGTPPIPTAMFQRSAALPWNGRAAERPAVGLCNIFWADGVPASDLEVGEGCSFPGRDELLCLAAADGSAPPQTGRLRVYDLCAGSGCVGLGLASLLKGVEVTAVELSPEAFVYLERNCEAYPAYAVRPVLADICRDAGRFPDRADAILSNPPYIPAGELPGLQREVRREPRMALDGGDGLRFYRVIADAWLPKLVPGGFVAVEVGIGQAEAVAELFAQAGLKDVGILPDYAGIGRVVLGFRPI